MDNSDFEKLHEEFHKHAHEKVNRTKIALGAITIIFGILLMIRNLKILSEPFSTIFSTYLISWQSLCIFIGLYLIFKHHGISFNGFLLIAIGSFFIARKYLEIDFNEIIKYWPILLIIFGLSLIFQRKTCSKIKSEEVSQDYFREFRVFNGGSIVIDSKQFKGGRSTTIFGGNEINCSNAELDSGNNVIEMFALFGGSSIIVPRDWNIKVDVVALVGGINDRRSKHTENINPQKTLTIRGVVIFGGGEIRNQKSDSKC